MRACDRRILNVTSWGCVAGARRGVGAAARFAVAAILVCWGITFSSATPKGTTRLKARLS